MRNTYDQEGYREEVQKSIGFMGQGLDFFTEVKAQCLLDIAKRRLGDLSKASILDIGCGVGLTDSYIHEHFGSLHGVDIGAPSIESAREAIPTGHFEVYDGKVLPYEDDTFDLAFAINVMHHVPPAAWDDFVSEARRVIRKGGLFVVFEHNPLNPLTRLAVFRCAFDGDAVLLRHGKLKQLFAGNGLDPVEGRFILFFPFRSGVLRAVEKRLGRLPLGAQQYLIGQKP